MVGRNCWFKTIPEYWDSSIVLPSHRYIFRWIREHAGRLLDVHDYSLADTDQDGTKDLLAFKQDFNSFAHAGGTLQAHRGVANERWRHAGGVWQPAADYDGDGFVDFLAVYWNTINALSGKTGQRLWQANISGYEHDTLKPLQTDLDGDAVPDIMAYQAPCYGNAGVAGSAIRSRQFLGKQAEPFPGVKNMRFIPRMACSFWKNGISMAIKRTN